MALDALLLLSAWSHVLLTPYTKVEESFNLHATHDVLVYGVDASRLSNYDHFVFPGAVPRSFLASIALAWSSHAVILPLRLVLSISSKADLLITVRLVLATLNALGLCALRRAVTKRFGFSTGAFFTILTCTQFHLPFWMGRTLPNMFALLPVNLAFSYILDHMPNGTRPPSSNVKKSISLLTFTAVVLRAEVLLLLGPLLLQSLLARWISFTQAVRTGLIAASGSILLTTILDSYFWQQWPLWPELYSVYFNVYQNKSAEWGVSPFHTYFSVHLPKLLLSGAPLAAIGLLVEPRVRSLLLSPLVFVGLMSFLGHKEWRFVVYVVPLFNVAAARGAYWLSRQRTRTILGRLSLLIVLGCIAANVLITAIMTQASMANYPGGVALSRFNELFDSTQNVHVHIDNLAAQTGASLFLHTHAPPYPSFLPSTYNHGWTYNKTEHLSPAQITSSPHFTHAITEHPSAFLEQGNKWEMVECVRAFDGFRLDRTGGGSEEGKQGLGVWERVPRVRFTYTEKLCILSRKG